MALFYKIAGQSAPVINTDTPLYTVPAATQFVGSTISICNRATTGSPVAFRVAVIPSGGTLAIEHYLIYDELIDVRSSKRFTLGITLAAGDKVVVRTDSASLSFTLFGSEIS